MTIDVTDDLLVYHSGVGIIATLNVASNKRHGS